MVYPHGGLLVWFGRGQTEDEQYLQTWRDAPLTYSSEEINDVNWAADRYEVILGQDSSGALFRRAAELTLYNRFYPREVMSVVSDYSLEGRTVQVGDRVLQRIALLEYEGLPLLDVLTLNRITEVIQEPRQVGFTYTTTSVHSEVGEWSPRVEWRENNEVALVIEVVSRADPKALAFIQRRTRQLQLHAHKLSIQYFLAQLKGEPGARPQSFARRLPKLAPVALALLLIPILLLFGARLSVHPKD